MPKRKAFRIRRVGLVLKPHDQRARQLGRRIRRHLEGRGIELVADVESAHLLQLERSAPRRSLARSVDLIIAIGGDGTFLSVARHAGGGARILGVNAGNLGFLTEAAPDQALGLIDAALTDEAPTEARAIFDVGFHRNGEQRGPYRVLNDVVLNKGALARIATFRIDVDGRLLVRFRSDGVILSSPTGSTAYSLSAGGPIVHPAIDAIVVTPICPHTLTNRPIVLPGSSVTEATLEQGDEAVFLTLDGQEGFPMQPGDRVVFSRSKLVVTLVRSPDRRFADVLRSKLHWGEPFER